jgi:hypothetical protein
MCIWSVVGAMSIVTATAPFTYIDSVAGGGTSGEMKLLVRRPKGICTLTAVTPLMVATAKMGTGSLYSGGLLSSSIVTEMLPSE